MTTTSQTRRTLSTRRKLATVALVIIWCNLMAASLAIITGVWK